MGWMPLEMGRSSQSPKVFSVLTDAVQYIYIQQCSSNKRYNVSYCCCVTVRGLWIAQAVLVALGFGRVALVAWGLVWLPLGMGGLPWLPGGVGGLPVTQSIKLHRPGAPPKMDPVSD